VLEVPAPTRDLEQALEDLNSHGCCILLDALNIDAVEELKQQLDRQYAAEQTLGELCPDRGGSNKQVLPNMVNKGQHYLRLVEDANTDAIASYLLGKNWLLSSLTAHLFVGPTTTTELIHRDQGQIPASIEFPALCNLFYLLDDFTPQRGSTVIFPGSHRWPLKYRIHPPETALGKQISAPAGSLFVFDGRLWHGTGANFEGHRRRAISVFCCSPWVRQQENACVSTARDIFEQASPKLRARLGLRTYGTLGNINGTRVANHRAAFGSTDVEFPDALIGENAQLIPLQSSRRE
jgi:ectoine hydroxylase-related dioxygenase (phytanoyl-CoA dioxygenase family)